MKASEVFVEAALILKARGLAKGILEDEKGAVCVAGAIQLAETGRTKPWGFDPNNRLGAIEIIVGQYPPDWNNHPDRTQAEVIAVLDAAAVSALQEEGIEPEDVL